MPAAAARAASGRGTAGGMRASGARPGRRRTVRAEPLCPLGHLGRAETALPVHSFGAQDLIGAERVPRELAGRWRQSRSRCIRRSPSHLMPGVRSAGRCAAADMAMIRRHRTPPASVRRRLLAGKPEFCLPWTVHVDNLPVAFGDALRVKGSTRGYLPCDGQCGHPDAVRCQVSAEHCRGRPEGRLAEGNGRQGRDRVVGEPAPGDEDGPDRRLAWPGRPPARRRWRR